MGVAGERGYYSKTAGWNEAGRNSKPGTNGVTEGCVPHLNNTPGKTKESLLAERNGGDVNRTENQQNE
jgi:hypothetical protein